MYLNEKILIRIPAMILRAFARKPLFIPEYRRTELTPITANIMRKDKSYSALITSFL